MVKKNMNEGKKGIEKNQRKNIRTLHKILKAKTFKYPKTNYVC